MSVPQKTLKSKRVSLGVPYFQVPNAVFDVGLDVFQKLAYVYLCRCGNQGGDAFPSYTTIAKKTGMSRRRAITAIKVLEQVGLVAIVRRPKNNKDNAPNLYTVRVPRASRALDLVHRGHHPSARGASYKELLKKEPSYQEPLGTGSDAVRRSTMSFFEFKTGNLVDEETARVIEYFLNKYRAEYGKEHIALKVGTWEKLCKTLLFIYDDKLNRSDSVDDDILESMVDCYFSKVSSGNYEAKNIPSLTHFNNNGIKLVNYYDSLYV